MNTAPKLTCAVLGAAVLFGLSGLTSVASAAEPTSGITAAATPSTQGTDTPGAGTNVGATRSFEVVNNSGRTLTVSNVFGTTGSGSDGKVSPILPDDSYPAVGTTVAPNGVLDFQVHAWGDHGLDVFLTDGTGNSVTVNMHVWAWGRDLDAWNSPGNRVQYTFTPQPSVGTMTIGAPPTDGSH